MIIDTQLGQLEVNTSNNRISSIQFIDEPNAVQDEQDNPVRNQLIQFLNRERQDFTLDIQLKGTEFQLKSGNEILKVLYGEPVPTSKSHNDWIARSHKTFEQPASSTQSQSSFLAIESFMPTAQSATTQADQNSSMSS